jgi:hypothetical protein
MAFGIMLAVSPASCVEGRELGPDIAPAAHGVADYAQEYRCDAGRTPELGERTDSLDALGRLAHLREGLAAHRIEGYAGLLAAGLKVSRPGIIATAPVTAATANP